MTSSGHITVVVPTCRRPDLLACCLDRLAPGVQTLPADRYEVIVTDDGVPTAEAVVAEGYPWAKWVAGPRRGPAANRNNGVKHAAGEWVAFTDDDCVPTAGWLAAFAAAADDEAGGDVFEGKTTCEAGIRSPLDNAPVNLTGGHLWSCNLLVRRAAFQDLGGFDENFPHPYLEDNDFHNRLKAAGRAVGFVPGAVVDHPPRRLPGGWKLGRYHASFPYYWRKSGRRGWVTPWFFRHLVSTRVRMMLAYRLQSDTVRAVWSLAVEVVSGMLWVAVAEWRLRRAGPRVMRRTGE